jgi:carbonic anhydrase/acetyltransferase-like protein (isoleucine patch superfamily)|nr:hypothetical protein [Natronomonas aquatica]
MGATVLDESVIGERAVIGANSPVTEGTDVEPGTLYAGAPATKLNYIGDTHWTEAGDRYVELARRHAEGSDRID